MGMEKSIYYVSCTGKLCYTLKCTSNVYKPRLYIVTGIVMGTYGGVIHFNHKEIL